MMDRCLYPNMLIFSSLKTSITQSKTRAMNTAVSNRHWRKIHTGMNTWIGEWMLESLWITFISIFKVIFEQQLKLNIRLSKCVRGYFWLLIKIYFYNKESGWELGQLSMTVVLLFSCLFLEGAGKFPFIRWKAQPVFFSIIKCTHSELFMLS